MIDNFALVVAHFCMGFFLWRVVRHEMEKRERENAERRRRIDKARR